MHKIIKHSLMESGEENLKNNKVFESSATVSAGSFYADRLQFLPVAGLFLGIGSSFTNETMLKHTVFTA